MSVCPLSHAGIMLKRLDVGPIIKLFSPLGSHTILVFHIKQYGASNAVCMKKCDFRPISLFISETIQDTAIVAIFYFLMQFGLRHTCLIRNVIFIRFMLQERCGERKRLSTNKLMCTTVECEAGEY